MNKKINNEFLNELRAKSTKLTIEFADLSNINKTTFKKLREDLGYSQHVFSNILGVSKKTIEKWEQGKNPIKGPTARLLYLINDDHKLLDKLYTSELSYSDNKAPLQFKVNTTIYCAKYIGYDVPLPNKNETKEDITCPNMETCLSLTS